MYFRHWHFGAQFDIRLALFGSYSHQSMNKLKILVLAFPSTSTFMINTQIKQAIHKKNSRCTNCLPCRLNKCVNTSSSSTDDIDNIPETLGDFESPESVSEISDGESVLLDPTNQQFPHTSVANMHVPPILAFWCIV